jgi:hypothetical protein
MGTSTPKTRTPGQPLTEKQAQALREVSIHQSRDASHFKRCFEATASPRQAIACKCKECVVGDLSAITCCTSEICPLFRYRPIYGKADPS